MDYLVVAIAFFALGMILGSIVIIYKCGYILEERKRERDKFKAYYVWFDRWLDAKEKGSLSFERLRNARVDKVAIYGQGRIGKHVEYELESNGFQVIFYIDEYEDEKGKELYTLRDEWPAVDLIIVTVLNEYKLIETKISEKYKEIKVISVNDLVEN